jgi:hypothetical protein
MGYTFTGRPGEAFCHIAAYAHWINLGFNRGADLPDPKRLLIGSGRLVRHLRMSNSTDLSRPFVRPFVRAAIATAKGSPGGAVLSQSSAPISVVRAVYPRRRRPKSSGKVRPTGG